MKVLEKLGYLYTAGIGNLIDAKYSRFNNPSALIAHGQQSVSMYMSEPSCVCRRVSERVCQEIVNICIVIIFTVHFKAAALSV